MATKNKHEAFRHLFEKKQLEPFIRHIRFPHYKNLAPNTKLEFSYPITAIVGANGTNKSSVLKALYGAPGDYNLGTLWFSTKIDPIADTGERPCFIYGYLNQDSEDIVEIIKTRIEKDDDPDYWEPSRPILKYGMKKMPSLKAGESPPEGRSITRWNTIEKNVVYLDFRGSLSAFDKVFYHGELRSQLGAEADKKDFIRARSPYLLKAVESGQDNFSWYGRERIIGKINGILASEKLEEISKILGRNYSEIRLIRHRFFNCDAYSCIMYVSGLRYSEAFAGSGEFSVVRMVVDVMNAPGKSLVLLDEPEVSLHPGAQERLLNFLFEQVKIHKHQVVFSTHSPALLRKLPQDAIKVLEVDSSSQKVVLRSQSALPEEAFFHIGEPIAGRIKIIVEDELAVAIVDRALESKGEAVTKLFDVKAYLGGSQDLWGRRIPVYATENRTDIFVLFDKDQQSKDLIPESNDISDSALMPTIKKITGMDVKFPVDGGDGGTNHVQENNLRRAYIAWVKKHVDYLPGDSIPEQFIWDNMTVSDDTKKIIDTNYKDRFEKLTRHRLGFPDYKSVTSEQILTIQRQQLATIPANNQELTDLRNKIMAFHSSNQSG